MTKKIIELSFDKVRELENQTWFGINLATVRIEDKKNNRFTDCHFSLFTKNGRIYYQISHEKGYPSEHKGTISKTIVGSWLSKELPKL